MKELNQEQHIQLLQFMSLMQTCKTEEELQALKEQYFNIPRYEFLQDYISEKSENQSLSSYKTSLIYEMDKYQHDYKIVYGENFPAYKKETMPNNKADYTVIHLLNEISECDDIEAYQKLMEEKNRFPRVKIEALSHEFTGIYFSNENELPTNIILNSPESNFNARRQLVEAGYSPFTLPSVEDVRENGFEWLHEEISHFKETLNPNFIEQETQRNQEPEFNEQEYEEEYDDFIEPMDENDGMSAMAAEADYNGSLIENEDIDEVQHQIDIDNGLIDENENEIMYDGSESEQEENFEEYIHSEKFISKILDTPTNSMKVNKSLNTEFSNNDIPVENNEVEQEPKPENESQNYENNNSNVSAPKPKNKQELHQFFINNPYTSGTPVPTIAMRNEQTGHSTFIEGYEFARLEDIGKPNPAFRDENGKQIKPDGQTVVLTKPAFKEVIDEETGEKKLVPDDKNRKFIRISRDLYEQAIKNSEIIAKRNPKTEQEKQKMLDDYLEAAHLDEKKQLANTASNFWHNYKAGVMTIANNKQEAMAFAKRLVIEMIPSEREKFAAMVRKYEKLRGTDGKHLSYDQRIIDFYDNMGLKITNNSIWRDHVDEKYNTLDAIKQNTEVFDKEGQPLDKSCRMKIGDTIKMSVTVDSALSNKKIKLPIQEYRLVAHSKDNNSVALISADGKQKIIKNREDFIKEVQKVEKKLMKKQQREDRYESISM
ncbi:hypothetical protein [Treponema porcinum]|uniref:Uncharacterized protein n=1 Tax=Treponema porcinum TaxID=261392 RepID=A0A1T4JKJ7_TREPO|nr:hypothetical protein [Treponema porcinum]SJZ30633.1 hypothetical protein SAMN02745149_00504 [Treponema porcinum]